MFKVGDEVIFYGESPPDCPYVEGAVYIITDMVNIQGEIGYGLVENDSWYALPHELVKPTKLHRALR